MTPAPRHTGANPRLLGWSFAGIAALFPVMAFVTILLSVSFSHHADELANNTLISIKQVSRIGRDVDRQRLLINEQIAESESDRIRAITPRIAELDEDIAAAKRSYDPLTTLPGEHEAWRVLAGEIAALKGPIAEILALSSANQDAGARAALVVLNERYDDIDRGIEKLIRINQDRADEVLARIEVLQRSSLLMFVAMGSAGLIVTLLVGLRVHRRIRRSEEDASLYATELEAQNKVLEITDWVRAQHVALAKCIQGELPVEELGAQALTALVDASGADVGAFWVRESAGLRRVAGHALDASAPLCFADGEGLVGQIARDQKLRHLCDVPGDFLRVRAGSGERDPVEIVLLPAFTGGQTQAVLELGFLRTVEKRALDLLERVGETLAVAVRSAAYRTRLGELLEESRRQADELHAQQEELRTANEELQLQGDNLRAASAEFEKLNTGLEQASQYKSDFLANMSHELRTPLNSTLVLAKLLSDNASGNLTEEQVSFAQTIESAGQDLLALIDGVLDLAKIEAGKVEARVAPTTVGRVVEPVVKMFEPITRDKGLTFSVSLGDREAALETDAQRVQQVLRNLLSNAVKFTDEGEVSLRVELSGDDISFTVRDTGVGIPEDQRQVIFEAFRQVDGTANRRFGGTGLGLSISRDLARLLGGDIRVTGHDGKGSTFVLSLPRRSEPIAPRDVHRVAPARIPATASPLSDDAPAFADDRGSLDGTRRVLLIVDDEVPFAEVLAKLATELDFQYIVAHRADAAVRLASQYAPSAIILDLHLPDYSGLAAIDRLKRDPATRHIPIYVISALEPSAALSMGAIEYLQKPATSEALIATLHRMKDRFERARRVLIVEDDPVQRGAIGRLLEATLAQVVLTSTVAAALAELSSSTFDCVVLDLKLGEESGYDLLEKMAIGGAYVFPPVIVYTGRSLTPDEEQRLRRYSSSIIIKGARSPERLLDEVTLFLHQVESILPDDLRRMLDQSRGHEAWLEGRSILVAEDDARNIFALSKLLEPRGAKLHIARNGREALEIVDTTPDIDLVLMDIMMPEMNGLQAIESLRRRGGRASLLPIIALTAKAMPDDRERCRAAGASDYIAKPLDVDVLLSLIRVWIGR